MTDDLRKAFQKPRNAVVKRLVSDNKDESEDLQDFGSFGRLRGIRDRALFIEFRLVDGQSWALSYAHLYRVDYTPTSKITLEFSEHIVTVSGRNLGHLHDSLVCNRATWVQATAPSRDFAADKECVVLGITLSPVGKHVDVSG